MRALAVALLLVGCGAQRDEARRDPPAPPTGVAAERDRMVREQIEERGVQQPRVLAAMRFVPRHEFVPVPQRPFAYEDRPLPIGHDQTISQPYIVAVMAEVADIGPEDRVLEIGTGSGYGAAVLSRIAAEVFTIEILEPLADRARGTLERLGYENVAVRHGDGYQGWPAEAPFDAILVTAAPDEVPEPLKQQLTVGGNLVIPVGRNDQWMQVITRTSETEFKPARLFPVRFVPMTGEVRKKAR